MYRIALIALTLFVAVGAIAGGWGLIVEADLGMDLALLDGTPFSSFVIPGYILAVAVGGSNLVAGLLLLARYRHAPFAALVAGAILTIWIAVQVAMIGYATMLQPIYFALGLLTMFIARQIVLREYGDEAHG